MPAAPYFSTLVVCRTARPTLFVCLITRPALAVEWRELPAATGGLVSNRTSVTS
jgi:hypothetical protein